MTVSINFSINRDPFKLICQRYAPPLLFGSLIRVSSSAQRSEERKISITVERIMSRHMILRQRWPKEYFDSSVALRSSRTSPTKPSRVCLISARSPRFLRSSFGVSPSYPRLLFLISPRVRAPVPFRLLSPCRSYVPR